MIKYPLNVTIDTNIFEAGKFNFEAESSIGLLVKYVEKEQVRLVMSDIVIKEVEKHICLRVDEACRNVKKLNKELRAIFPKEYYAEKGMESYFQTPDIKYAKTQVLKTFEQFLEKCKAEIMSSTTINLENVIDDYFEVQPPFEDKKEKRKEFPDAFIVSEIKSRFGDDKAVIISKDKGLKNALISNSNYTLFDSLNKLYDYINKEEEEIYKRAVEYVETNNDSIINEVENMIDNSYLEVQGLSYDKDGVPDGYDYDDFELVEHNLIQLLFHTIDDINGDTITASFWVRGEFNVMCSFKDVDNAYWDSETKDYVFYEMRRISEFHDARFACRVELNMSTNDIKILPFKIILGGDSRKSREEVYNN